MHKQDKLISAAIAALAIGILAHHPAMTVAQITLNDTTPATTTTTSSASSIEGQYDNNTAQLPIQAATNSSNRFSLESLKSEGAPILGNESAPVTIIDFSDFQCPNCARFVKSTEPEINREYIATGKAVLVFKHFPRLGSDSFSAALASECADEQGKFWEYHNILYENQQGQNSGWASIEKLKDFASQTGLDRQQFDPCLESEKYKPVIDRDLALVKELNLQSTPSFLILKSDGTDMETLSGAHPFPSFKALIDKRLP